MTTTGGGRDGGSGGGDDGSCLIFATRKLITKHKVFIATSNTTKYGSQRIGLFLMGKNGKQMLKLLWLKIKLENNAVCCFLLNLFALKCFLN